MEMKIMFRVEDAVLVDSSDYELASPGTSMQLPGVVLAVNEGPHLFYYVRVRLQLGATMDLTVPAEKVSEPECRSRRDRRAIEQTPTPPHRANAAQVFAFIVSCLGLAQRQLRTGEPRIRR
jgi:hypothetical protein